MKSPGAQIHPVLIILVILAAVVLAGCISSEKTGNDSGTRSIQKSGNETVRIGAIYNLEGSEATFDVPSMQGANLAVKEINLQGGINGKPFELVLVNGKSNTSAVVAGAHELAGSGTIPVIIGLSNPDHALPAARAAASQNVYFVTSGATSPRLPQQVPGYLYLACMGDNTQAAAGAEYAAGILKVKNAYILYESDKQYPTLLASYFMTRFLELNGTVQKVDTFHSTDTSFSSQVANLYSLSPQPDIVFVSAETWADAKPVIGEVRNAGFTMPIMGGDGYDAPTLLTGGAAGVDNVYFTTHTWFDPATTNKKQQDFMARYEQEYNSSAVPFAGLGYDTVMIVAEAIRSPGSPDRFSEGMANITHYTGVTGNLTYNDNSHIPVKMVTLMKIQNSTLVHIGDFMPVKVPSP
ncbi:MAG: ABC transporter substrate-binding protein [Methanomicrobiales archaeon]